MDFDNQQDLKDYVKANVTMDDVLEMCNIELPNNRKITSIYNPEENTPSLHVYTHDFFDFSTGRGGDQITFVMDHFGTSYNKALRFLARFTTDLISEGPARNETPEKPIDLTDRFYNEPEGLDADYANARLLISRKWPTLTLDDLLVFSVRVVRHALWVPHFSPEAIPSAVRGIKTRSVYTGQKHSVKGSNYRTSLYRAVNLPGAFESVIVEGESDCWTMTKALEGIPVQVWALPSGVGLWRDKWIEQLGRGQVTLCLDGDEAGRKATERIRGRLVENGRRMVKELQPPGGRVSEALAAGWDPLGERTREWLQAPKGN